MDEKLVDELLNEDLPEWKEDDLQEIDDLCSKDEFNEELSIADNLDVVTDEFQSNIDTASIGSNLLTINTVENSLYNELEINSSKRSNHSYSIHVKHSILSKLTNQIKNPKENNNSFKVTCCIRNKYLALGTNQGLVFLFDLKQVLRCLVGSKDRSEKFGSVSSVSFNYNSTRLLVGYVKSHIDMWDIGSSSSTKSNSGHIKTQLLRSINVSTGPSYSLCYVRFLSDPTLACYSDSQGSVYLLTFKRGIAGRTTDIDCFFSGSRGEILTIEPLLFSNLHSQPQAISKANKAIFSSLDEYNLLAMASFTKLLIVSSKPNLRVQFTHSLKGSPETLPVLAWSLNNQLFYQSTNNSTSILLTFARDQQIYILQILLVGNNTNIIASSNSNQILNSIGKSDFQFPIKQTVLFAYKILSFKWLNNFILGILDFEENLHIFDVKSETTIEILDMSHTKLVYNTSLFKAIATGVQVSEAMSLAAERVCYHSISERNGQMKLLGDKYIYMVMLRQWTEVLQMTNEQHGPIAMLQLCAGLYRGPSANWQARVVLGLPLDDVEREKRVAEHACIIIEHCINQSDLINHHGEQHPPINDSIQLMDLFSAILQLCQVTKQISFYTDSLYFMLPSDNCKIACLRNLLPLINNKQLSWLHPELVQRLVDYLLSIHHLAEIDKILVKLHISCLDIDYIIRISKKHQLFQSMIYVYNEAFHDYLTPLEQMLAVFTQQDFLSHHPDIQNELVIRCIVYIHECLSDSNDHKLLDPELDQRTLDIFQYLLKPSLKRFHGDSASTTTGALISPLFLLLELNSQELFNMLTLVLDQPFFIHPELGGSRKQMLLEHISSGGSCYHSSSSGPSRASSINQLIQLIVFVSRELIRPPQVYIEHAVIELMLEQLSSQLSGNWSLCDAVSSVVRRQLESTLIQLYNHFNELNTELILNLAKNAQLLRLCESIYRKKGLYHMVLESYLLDNEYKKDSFRFLDVIWHNPNLSDQQRQDLLKKCFELATNLVEADSRMSVIILLTLCRKHLNEVITQLTSNQTSTVATLEFLQILFTMRGDITVLVDETNDALMHSSCASANLSPDHTIILHLKTITIPSEIALRFIELLVEHERGEILLDYLHNSVEYQAAPVISILEKSIEKSSNSNIWFSLGFLYEKSKIFQNAAELYIKLFDSYWLEWMNQSAAVQNHGTLDNQFQTCIKYFVSLVCKCQRNNTHQKLWKLMMDSILDKYIQYKFEPDSTKIKALLTSFVKCMSSNTDYSVAMILSAMLKNPIIHQESYGQSKDLFLTLIQSYLHESSLLQSGLKSMGQSINSTIRLAMTTQINRATVLELVGPAICYICNEPIKMHDEESRLDNNLLWMHSKCKRNEGQMQPPQIPPHQNQPNSKKEDISPKKSKHQIQPNQNNSQLFPDINRENQFKPVQLNLSPPSYLINYSSYTGTK